MAASLGDAHPFPIYGARFRLGLPLLDADGDLVTGASSPDSEISKDQGTFADCTNEITEIATASGMYYLDLTGPELTCEMAAVIIKSATSGMKTTPVVLYPQRLPIIHSGTAQAGASTTITLASGASSQDDFYTGAFVVATNDTPSGIQGEARVITGYVGSTKVATIAPAWGTNPSSSTTYDIRTRTAAQVTAGYASGVVGAVGSVTGNVGGNLVGSAGSIASGGITAASFASDAITAAKIASDVGVEIAAAVWDRLTSALTTVGSIGKLLVDNINATISSRATQTSVDTIDDFVDTEVAAILAAVDTEIAALPTAAGIADAVWDELLSGHAGVGSTGAALSAAGGSGDPWATALPGAYGSGTAGKIIGDNINATISSRATQTSVDTVDDFLDTEIATIISSLTTIDDFLDTEIAAILAAVDTEVGAIKSKTDNLPASPAATGDAMTLTAGERNSVADALLNRNVAGGSSTGRTVKEAFYRLRNRVAVSAGTATVYGTDDSTSAWTAAITTTAGNPVSEVDPS